MGSGTVREMSEWVEYMTFNGVSPMADLRKENGHEEPWTVDYLGVGNENWGCGGNMRPTHYADEYRRISGNDIWVHGIDLQGYGTQQFHGKKTNIIAGWSEKVLDFILLAERGEDTLIQRISNYHW